MDDAPPLTVVRINAKTGPSSALKVKFRKFTTPVAVPLIWGGFASFITVYGSIAAPDTTPATMPTMAGGNTPGRPYRIHARQASRTTALTKMTGLRRPMRSEIKPSSGHPMIQPNGTVDDRITAVA